jgi:hypothetical protein
MIDETDISSGAADAAEEWTSEPVDRDGPAAFVHLIRGPSDPAEMPRGVTSERRERWGVAPHRKLDGTRVGHWTGPLLKLIREQPELTFNALCVTLTGLTADVAFGTPLDDALWALVERGLVEHTRVAPIRWRAAVAGAGGEDASGPAEKGPAGAQQGEQLGLFEATAGAAGALR